MTSKPHLPCPHTLYAVRRQELKFQIEAKIMLPGVGDSEIKLLASAAARIFSDIDPIDMPESVTDHAASRKV